MIPSSRQNETCSTCGSTLQKREQRNTNIDENCTVSAENENSDTGEVEKMMIQLEQQKRSMRLYQGYS